MPWTFNSSYPKAQAVPKADRHTCCPRGQRAQPAQTIQRPNQQHARPTPAHRATWLVAIASKQGELSNALWPWCDLALSAVWESVLGVASGGPSIPSDTQAKYRLAASLTAPSRGDPQATLSSA